MSLSESQTLELLSRLPSPALTIGIPAAAMCIISWDYVITMTLTFRFLVSGQPWFVKLSYLINRYSGLASIICFTLIGAQVPIAKTCALTAWLGVSFWALMGLNNTYLLLRRVWIISSRDNTIILALLPFVLAITGLLMAVLAQTKPFYVPVENLCAFGLSQTVSPLRTRILLAVNAIYDLLVLTITLHKVRQIIKITDGSTSLQNVLESYSLYYYLIMITIQVIALGLSLYDPVLCDTIIPLIDAVVCLSLQRIMLEDVDYSTRDRLKKVRNFINLNLHINGPKDVSQAKTNNYNLSTFSESSIPTKVQLKNNSLLACRNEINASSIYDVSQYIQETPTSSNFTQSEKIMSLAASLKEGKNETISKNITKRYFWP